jgi:catechol 2,3-dioxygenase-like lactoylglutathione lyase family enzyme
MSDRLPQPETFGHAEVGVTDLAEAIRFHVEALGFGIRHSGDGVAQLTTDDRSTALVLRQRSEPGLLRLSYQVTEQDLDAFAPRLTEAGVAVERVETPLPDIAQALDFRDPNGYALRLFVPTEPVPTGQPPQGKVKLLHPLLGVTDLGQTLEFYEGLLGFRVSDFIGDRSAFLRCRDGFHHSVAVHRQTQRPRIDHLCFLHSDFDSLMRARVRAQKVGKVECTELLRHSGSESITFYFNNPHVGFQFEWCVEHRSVEAPDHTPRRLPDSIESFNMWQSA